MKDRWLPIGVLAAVLFAVNVAARLVARFGFDGEAERQDVLSLVMFAVIGVILATVSFVWSRRRPTAQWSAEMAVVVLSSMALVVLVGPFVSGLHPFANGAGEFFSQVFLYAGFTAVGSLLGFLLATALGLDYRSQSLKRYAETVSAKPRRVARR